MQEAEKKRQMLRQEAREIAQALLKTGTPPTRRLVGSMIARSPIKTSHLIAKEIRKVIEEVQNLRAGS
jgi:ribosomal protein L17